MYLRGIKDHNDIADKSSVAIIFRKDKMTQGMMLLAVRVNDTKRLMHVLAPDRHITKCLDPFASKGWSAISPEMCTRLIETWFEGDDHHGSLCTTGESAGVEQNLRQR